jgi:hypothetical protein
MMGCKDFAKLVALGVDEWRTDGTRTAGVWIET